MDPLLELSDVRFKLRLPKPTPTGSPRQLHRQSSGDATTLNAFRALARDHDAFGFALSTGVEFGWPEKFADLEENAKAVKRVLVQKIADAEEKHGQVEVVEAQLAVASHVARTGSVGELEEAWKKVDLKSLSTGKKIDAYFERARFGFAWEDYRFVKEALLETNRLLEIGGDWDRRNRLKVYNGLHAMVTRNFKKASQELLSCVATFTADELLGYDRFVMYTMLTSLVALDRVPLRTEVVQSPEIVAVLDACYGANSGSSYANSLSPGEVEVKMNTAAVGRLVAALYECRYRDFMQALLNVHDVLKKDRYFARHIPWFLREMRTKAYAQYLTSYRSVKLTSMATAFGVSVEFMDEEISRFVAFKKLNSKIDKVAGVVETNRPDTVNAKYQDVIKQGDVLLSRVQKLARAVNV